MGLRILPPTCSSGLPAEKFRTKNFWNFFGYSLIVLKILEIPEKGIKNLGFLVTYKFIFARLGQDSVIINFSKIDAKFNISSDIPTKHTPGDNIFRVQFFMVIGDKLKIMLQRQRLHSRG